MRAELDPASSSTSTSAVVGAAEKVPEVVLIEGYGGAFYRCRGRSLRCWGYDELIAAGGGRREVRLAVHRLFRGTQWDAEAMRRLDGAFAAGARGV